MCLLQSRIITTFSLNDCCFLHSPIVHHTMIKAPKRFIWEFMSDFVVDPFKTVKDQLDLNNFVIHGISSRFSRFCWELDAITVPMVQSVLVLRPSKFEFTDKFLQTSWFGVLVTTFIIVYTYLIQFSGFWSLTHVFLNFSLQGSSLIIQIHRWGLCQSFPS